jgi:hypothetical protein
MNDWEIFTSEQLMERLTRQLADWNSRKSLRPIATAVSEPSE